MANFKLTGIDGRPLPKKVQAEAKRIARQLRKNLNDIWVREHRAIMDKRPKKFTGLSGYLK